MLLAAEDNDPGSPLSDSSSACSPLPTGIRNGVSPLPTALPPRPPALCNGKPKAEGESPYSPDQRQVASPLRLSRPPKSPVPPPGSGHRPDSPTSGASRPRTATPSPLGPVIQRRLSSRTSMAETADTIVSVAKDDVETGLVKEGRPDAASPSPVPAKPHENGHVPDPESTSLQYSFSKPPGETLPTYPRDNQKCRLRGICKSLLCNAMLIVVYLTITFCYTLGGGAVLVALDEPYYREQVGTLAARMAELGFNETQRAFLASQNIPPAPPQYTVWDGQQYALQLVTTIGYGNITSQTAAARWFAFFYSFVGIILVGYALVQMGPCMFQLMIDVLVLCAASLCIIRFHAGQAELWAQQVKVKYAYAFMDDADAPPLSLWDLRRIMTDISPDHPPDWGTVCAVVANAGLTKNGLVCRTELEKVVQLYARHIGQLQQNERQSVLFFKTVVLILWMFGGAWFYSEICPCLYHDYGSAVYYVLVTLTTIGTGDFYPCNETCEAFWFFHTAGGLGMMTVVTYLLGIRLQGMFQAAQNQRVELSTEYGYAVRCVCLRRGMRRLSAFNDLVRGVGCIMAYVAIGGAVFSQFEEQVPDPPPFLDAFSHLGLTAGQLKFVQTFAPPEAPWSFAVGMRYSLESITTIGYGDYSLRTGGARTFAMFYILFGLGMIGVQLESLGEASRVLLHLLFDTFSQRMKWQGVSMHRDDQLISKLKDLLDQLEQLAGRPEGLSMADLQQQVELACTASGIQTEMLEAMLGVSGMEAQLVHVDASCASVSLARLFHRVVVRRAVRELVGGSLVLLVVILTALPVFVYAESWTVGDAAWFCYITTTTIGLGDYATTSTLGLVWWYFLVFVTIGQLSVFFPSLRVVWRGVVQPRLRRRRRYVTARNSRPRPAEFAKKKTEAESVTITHMPDLTTTYDLSFGAVVQDGVVIVPTPDPVDAAPAAEDPEPDHGTMVEGEDEEEYDGPAVLGGVEDRRLIVSSPLTKSSVENLAA
eukprot:EG_transcript_844